MVSFTILVTLTLTSLISSTIALPQYGSLAGLSKKELDAILRTLQHRDIPDPPEPIKDTGLKLVNDLKHPYQDPQPGDIRGPCPGLNTLANHGYLPRNGIATPTQLINACQEGFNMNYNLASFITYNAHIVDGNVITDLLSIGGKTNATGPDPPSPAIVGGLNAHGPFEGDASMTREDAYFGDNFSFNETLFQELVELSHQYGAGKYNYTVAGEFRYRRIQDSIARNPEFRFLPPRYIPAYRETTFPVNFFIDGRQKDGQLDLDDARSFFQHHRMPKNFHRAPEPRGFEGLNTVVNAHPIMPGRNVGGVNTYTPDPNAPSFTNDPNLCGAYEDYILNTVLPLYPNPTGMLRMALNKNLDFFYQTLGGACEQMFPYGKD